MVIVETRTAYIVRAQLHGRPVLIVPDRSDAAILNLARAILDASEVRELEHILRDREPGRQRRAGEEDAGTAP